MFDSGLARSRARVPVIECLNRPLHSRDDCMERPCVESTVPFDFLPFTGERVMSNWYERRQRRRNRQTSSNRTGSSTRQTARPSRRSSKPSLCSQCRREASLPPSRRGRRSRRAQLNEDAAAEVRGILEDKIDRVDTMLDLLGRDQFNEDVEDEFVGLLESDRDSNDTLMDLLGITDETG